MVQLVAFPTENDPTGHSSHEFVSAAKEPAGQMSHLAWRPRCQPDSVIQEEVHAAAPISVVNFPGSHS